MRKLMTLLFSGAVLASCSGIDSIKYHDEIYAAHVDLLKNYEQLDKTFEEQTGKPEGKGVMDQKLAAFSLYTDSLITKVQGVEKLDDDAFKTAFVTYANGVKGIVNTDYKAITSILSIKEEDFTDEMRTKEVAAIDGINKKLKDLDDAFQKDQQAFAKKYDITLH